MDIGCIWNEKKYQRVVQEHQVRFYEVISAFDDSHGYELPDPNDHADRWLWIGKTCNGRVLFIIYSDEELPVYRIVTAYEAEGRWLDEYNRQARI